MTTQTLDLAAERVARLEHGAAGETGPFLDTLVAGAPAARFAPFARRANAAIRMVGQCIRLRPLGLMGW